MKLQFFALAAMFLCLSCRGEKDLRAEPSRQIALGFAGIAANDIESVEFQGPYLSLKEKDGSIGDPNYETNPGKIATILEAFAKSTKDPSSPEATGFTDNIIFHFAPSLKKDNIFIVVNGNDVTKDFGKDVSAIYNKYRQRPISDFNGGQANNPQP